MLGLDELERHLAIELGVPGQEDLAQGPRGVETEVAELGAGGGRVAAHGDVPGRVRSLSTVEASAG